jgi:hypothetical protein
MAVGYSRNVLGEKVAELIVKTMLWSGGGAMFQAQASVLAALGMRKQPHLTPRGRFANIPPIHVQST